jgi:type III secretory pathway component EscV
MMAPHLNLTPGDVKQMMEELQVLRELVVTLRKERDDTLALLATSDVRRFRRSFFGTRQSGAALLKR